ncbi:hypothetical protein [Heyndrickxia shackletonii]|uniref:hypothetical protein n=1 Tax=Heyndrickxia shackletonii TaxID=157838 RepID=UPI00137A23F4|nr:hypothetical protein [Heyndrickxia shackletonii]NEZ01918.1 hypothetical protein [Heyndrickxia shackletonii]
MSPLFTKKHDEVTAFLHDKGTSVRKHQNLTPFITDNGSGVHLAHKINPISAFSTLD